MRVIALLLLINGSASASFSLIVPPIAPVNAGNPGNSFEVVLFNSGLLPIGPFNVDSFNVQLTVSGEPGLTLTGVTNTTSLQYLFAGNSLGLLAIPGGTQIDWNDLTVIPPKIVAPGESYGLGRVYFDVAPNTPVGNWTVNITGLTTFSEFPTFNSIPYSANQGIITVTTPMPPSILMLGIGSVSLLRLIRQHMRQ